MQQVWAQFVTAALSCSLSSFPCSRMNSPSAAVSQEYPLTPVWVLQGLQGVWSIPFPSSWALASAGLFLTFFLAPLSLMLCSIFYDLKYVTREEPVVWLMGSAVPWSWSPGDGCAWHGTVLASPHRSHLCCSLYQHLGTCSQCRKQHRTHLGCMGNDLHVPGASSAQGVRKMSGHHLLMQPEF